MINVISIVEGDGEVAAVPVLLRRIGQWLTPQILVNISKPIRVRRDQFLQRDDVFRKQLMVASALCQAPGWILILLDADDDCPQELANEIHAKAKSILPEREISVVLAKREYEAWFIAAAQSLAGKRGFVLPANIPEADTVRAAKQWMSKQIPKGTYHSRIDQPAFSALVDLDQVHENSRSFRKLCSDWAKMQRLVVALDEDKI